MVYSELEKFNAAKELEQAEQAIRERSGFGTRSEMDRLKKAKKQFKKVTGKNP